MASLFSKYKNPILQEVEHTRFPLEEEQIPSEKQIPTFQGTYGGYNLYSSPQQSSQQGASEKSTSSRTEKWREPGAVQSFEDWMKDTSQADYSNEGVRQNAVLNYLRTPTQLDEKTVGRRAFAQAMSDVGRLIAQGYFGSKGARIQPIENRAGKLVDKAEHYAIANQRANQEYDNQKSKLLQSLDKMSEEGRKQYNIYKRDIQKAFAKTIEEKNVLSNEEYNKLSEEDKWQWRLNADGKGAIRVSGGSRSQSDVYAGYPTGKKFADGRDQYVPFTKAEAYIADSLAKRILRDSPAVAQEFQDIKKRIRINPQGKITPQELSQIFDAAYLLDKKVYGDVMKGYVNITQQDYEVPSIFGGTSQLGNQSVESTGQPRKIPTPGAGIELIEGKQKTSAKRPNLKR